MRFTKLFAVASFAIFATGCGITPETAGPGVGNDGDNSSDNASSVALAQVVDNRPEGAGHGASNQGEKGRCDDRTIDDEERRDDDRDDEEDDEPVGEDPGDDTCDEDPPEPIELSGNPSCEDLGLHTIVKFDGCEDGEVSVDGSLVRLSCEGASVSFDASVDAVIVKGGPGCLVYDGARACGDALTTPVNPNNGSRYDVSHVEFCSAR